MCVITHIACIIYFEGLFAVMLAVMLKENNDWLFYVNPIKESLF